MYVSILPKNTPFRPTSAKMWGKAPWWTNNIEQSGHKRSVTVTKVFVNMFK